MTPLRLCPIIPVAFVVAICGCTATRSSRIQMMPMPEAYRVVVGDDLPGHSNSMRIPYATDREVTGGASQSGYGNDRGRFVRVGFAEVDVLELDSPKPIAELGPVEETGLLRESVAPFDRLPKDTRSPAEASRLFARQLGERLRSSGATDVVIYVPGFKVEFPDAVLVSAMFQSFSEGSAVFAGYSWPSTPSLFAYFRDLESTGYSARNLRLFIRYLAAETSVRRIHILGFSAGTRLVIDALHQLSMLRGPGSSAGVLRRLRIGQVVLVGSDVDRQQFGNYLADGLLDVPESLTVYMSESDSALGFAKFLFTRHRLGQLLDESTLDPGDRRYLRDATNLVLVDVTGAEGARKSNGHSYFRYSPWVSGDVLLTLLAAIPPEERGLVREPGSLVWKFPEDYSYRLEKLAAE